MIDFVDKWRYGCRLQHAFCRKKLSRPIGGIKEQSCHSHYNAFFGNRLIPS
jgi:hypothetical protein